MSALSEKPSPLTERDREMIDEARAAARVRFAADVDGPADDRPDSVDPENAPSTDARLAALRPAEEVVPELVAARLRRKAASRDP